MSTQFKSSKTVLSVLLLGLVASPALAQEIDLNAAVQQAAVQVAAESKPSVKDKSPSKITAKSSPYDNIEALMVSDRDFNRFVFPEPIAKEGILLPGEVQLTDEPMYFNNNRVVILQFAKSTPKTAHQLVVPLESGRIVSIYFKPSAVPGVIHRVDGAPDVLSGPAKLKGKYPTAAEIASNLVSPSTEYVETTKSFILGQVPAGFEMTDALPIAHFEKFVAAPVASYTDSISRKVHIFELIAKPGLEAVVAPPMFYRPGVLSVLITADVVSNQSTPRVVIIEEVNDE